MSPASGRPHAENPKDQRITIRVTPDEKAQIQKICKDFGVTMSDLIRKGIEALKK